MKHLVFLLLILLTVSCQAPTDPPVQIEGELQQWHKITLLLKGPETWNYRVSFKKGKNIA